MRRHVPGRHAVGGGTSQTAVNRLAGARTQSAGAGHGGGRAADDALPGSSHRVDAAEPCSAVGVIVDSIGLINPGADFRVIPPILRTEFLRAFILPSLAWCCGGLPQGVLVAIVVFLVTLVHQSGDPLVRAPGAESGTNVFGSARGEHPEDETFPGLLMIQLEGQVFFANAERIGEKMRALADEAKPRVVALDLSGVPDLEYTALKMLIEGEKRQRERGVSVWLVGLNPEVLSVVQRSSLGKVLGRERMHFNLELAVARYLAAPVSERAV